MPRQRDITKGLFRQQRPLVIYWIQNHWDTVVDNFSNQIDPQIMGYAKGMARKSELPLNTVLKSQPVRNYRDRMWFLQRNK